MNKEDKYLGILGVFSLVSFAIAVVAWFMTINNIHGDVELLHSVHKINCYANVNNFQKTLWMVTLLWNVSVWYKVWIISAVASTALFWPCGGGLSLVMSVAALFLALASTIIPLGTIHLETWVFIVEVNICVFILWCVVVSIIGILKKKKEVSLQM